MRFGVTDAVKSALEPRFGAFGWRIASPISRAEHTVHRFVFGYTYAGGPLSVYGRRQREAEGFEEG